VNDDALLLQNLSQAKVILPAKPAFFAGALCTNLVALLKRNSKRCALHAVLLSL